MTPHDIVTTTDEQAAGLRSSAREVTDFGAETQDVIDALLDTMFSFPIAIGLAAPQIGVGLRIAVVNLEKHDRADSIILVNPKLEELSGKKDLKKESCMSVPGLRGDVERRSKMRISFRDRDGAPQQLSTHGFLARALQHEIDHLDGVLYVDRLKDGSVLEKTDIFD